MRMHRSRYIRKRKNDRSGTGRKGNCGISPQKMTVMIAAGGILLMIFLPEISLLSARKAVNLWLFTIVPSMFPFFICIDLLTKNGMHVYAGNLTDGFFRKVFGVPGTAGFVYVSSVLSGYPTGAKILGEMYESRQILRKDVYDILTFCSTSGPLFILGAVGVGMLHSASAGGVILAAHYAGSLLTGLILIRRSLLRRGISRLTRGRKMENSRTNMEKESGMPEQNVENTDFPKGMYGGRRKEAGEKTVTTHGKTAPEMLAESMLSSFQTLIVIGGYVVIFMILTDVLKAVLQYISGESGFIGEVVTGCLEMTSGCSGVAGSDAPLLWKIAACTFLISFGGLSVAAQSVSVLKNSGVPLSFFLRFKLMQGLISAACAVTIMKILSDFGRNTVTVFESSGAEAAVPAFSLLEGDPGAAYSLFFSSSAAAVVMTAFYLAVILFSGKGYDDENSGNHSGV